jgi:hypothetical protein
MEIPSYIWQGHQQQRRADCRWNWRAILRICITPAGYDIVGAHNYRFQHFTKTSVIKKKTSSRLLKEI